MAATIKNYYIMFNVGKAKYVLNYHDGEKTHKDNSPFYNVEIYKNKKKLMSKIKELQKQGYVRHLWDM